MHYKCRIVMKKINNIFLFFTLIALCNNAYGMKRSLEVNQPEDQIDGMLLLVASQEYNKIAQQENKVKWQKAQEFIQDHDFSTT